MTRVASAEVFEMDLPFRQPFRHAAARRLSSAGVLVRLVTDTGHVGYGETLPRKYVTGEEMGGTFDLLASQILPRMIGMEFASFPDLLDFLVRQDGVPPEEWIGQGPPRTAAWCAVDLALLDAFGRAFGVDPGDELARRFPDVATGSWPGDLRYGVVVSGDGGWPMLSMLLKARAFGLRSAKLKVDAGTLTSVALARRVLGRRASLRVDANMSWDLDLARQRMAELTTLGVESVEQPLPANDIEGMARLVADGPDPLLMADESFCDAASLERLIAAAACTAVNIRIAKCGGLVAALARCRRAAEAGLTVQIGCQTGESSLLSAAQMVLIGLVGANVGYAEGCFGERLLRADPARPVLQFRRGGRPPTPPTGPGFGVEVDMETVLRAGGRRHTIGAPDLAPARESP